jgi:propanediol dehydratase large subunit
LEDDVVRARNKGARAIQALFKELGLPEITEAEVEACTYAHGTKDIPDRNVVEDLKAIESMMARGVNGVDIVKALVRGGFPDVAESMFNMLKQRVSGDYLHPAAIIDENWHVISFVNALNDYHGPGTGYQISEERWEEIKNIPNAIGPDDFN